MDTEELLGQNGRNWHLAEGCTDSLPNHGCVEQTSLIESFDEIIGLYKKIQI